MINICVELGKTANDDTVINTEDQFPIAYIGRGSYTGNVRIHTYHYFSVQEEAHLIYIGRYTSIGDNVQIYCDINHDYRSVYMGVIPEFADPSEDAPIRERLGQMTSRMKHKGMVLIGNDVWIGNDVTLISDVTIGNGAVIGAGSVVTKDIPPYTIWCGNPAVCVGSRFSPEVVLHLQKISWWNWDRDQLKAVESDMKDEPKAFAAKYEPLAKDFRTSDPLFVPDNNLPVIITFLDTGSAFPTFGDIFEQFITGYSDGSANLIIYYYRDDEKDVATAGSLSGLLSKLAGRVHVFSVAINPEDDERVISRSDCLILGRDIRNIHRISWAQKYNVKCISGANKPVF